MTTPLLMVAYSSSLSSSQRLAISSSCTRSCTFRETQFYPRKMPQRARAARGWRKHHLGGEHVQVAVQLPALRFFIERVQPALLAHPLCDLFFMCMLRLPGDERPQWAFQTPHREYAYWLRPHSDQSHGDTASLQQQLARYLEDPDRGDSSPITFSAAVFRRERWRLPLILAASDEDILREVNTPAVQAMLVAPAYKDWLRHDRSERERRNEVLCRRCNRSGNRACKKCGQARYCSRECQVDDWRAGHKHECQSPEAS